MTCEQMYEDVIALLNHAQDDIIKRVPVAQALTDEMLSIIRINRELLINDCLETRAYMLPSALSRISHGLAYMPL